MHREEIIKDNPLAKIVAPKKPKRLPKILTEDELHRIFRAVRGDGERAILLLLLDSGIRLAELVNLDHGNVDFKNGVVTVIGKGDKQRHVFIGSDTAMVLELYNWEGRPEPRADNRFFLAEDGYPLTRSRVQKILENIGRRAGIKQRLSPHKLRHSYATYSLKHGANLELLRKSLGHTDLKTTEIYLSLFDADVQAAHKQFSPVKNLELL